MVSLVEVTAFVDEAHPLEISLPTPHAEGTAALLLVERLDGVEGGFEVDVGEIEAVEYSRYARASLKIGAVYQQAERIWSRIRVTGAGWFRARLLWVRGQLPAAGCYLCRRTLATLIGAGLAMIGVPMPDLTLGEILPDMLGALADALRTPPLHDLLDQLHPELADMLAGAIGEIDLVRAALDQLYRYCCEQLGLCPPRA